MFYACHHLSINFCWMCLILSCIHCASFYSYVYVFMYLCVRLCAHQHTFFIRQMFFSEKVNLQFLTFPYPIYLIETHLYVQTCKLGNRHTDNFVSLLVCAVVVHQSIWQTALQHGAQCAYSQPQNDRTCFTVSQVHISSFLDMILSLATFNLFADYYMI